MKNVLEMSETEIKCLLCDQLLLKESAQENINVLVTALKLAKDRKEQQRDDEGQ